MNNMTSEGNLSYILWGLSGSVVCIVFLIYAYILSRRANEECGNVRYYMANIDCSTVFKESLSMLFQEDFVMQSSLQ